MGIKPLCESSARRGCIRQLVDSTLHFPEQDKQELVSVDWWQVYCPDPSKIIRWKCRPESM